MLRPLARAFFAGVILPATLLIVTSEASAQVSPFRRAGLNLTKDDLSMIETASAKLYAGENPKIGASETWANAKSRNAGSVVLVAVYVWNKMPCRRLSHQIVSPARKDPYSVQVDRCQTSSGEWKIRY